MGDILKVLTEASPDNLFVIAGLLFLLLAVVGSVSGKFEMRGSARVISGVIGAMLLVSGLWMHSNHLIRVISASVESPQSAYGGPCPITVNLQGIIEAAGAGSVLYDFEYSDGTASPISKIDFATGGTQLVSANWSVHHRLEGGWARMRIVSPRPMEAKTPSPIQVECNAEKNGNDGSEKQTHISPSPKQLGIPPPAIIRMERPIPNFAGTWVPFERDGQPNTSLAKQIITQNGTQIYIRDRALTVSSEGKATETVFETLDATNHVKMVETEAAAGRVLVNTLSLEGSILIMEQEDRVTNPAFEMQRGTYYHTYKFRRGQ